MIVLEITIGETSGMINIAYPVIYLESILSKLANKDVMLGERNIKKSRNLELKELVKRADIPVEVLLGETRLSFKKILELKRGDTIRLKDTASNKALLTIDKKKMFNVQVGIKNGIKSVKIEDKIESFDEEILHILREKEESRKQKIETRTKEIING